MLSNAVEIRAMAKGARIDPAQYSATAAPFSPRGRRLLAASSLSGGARPRHSA